MLTNFIKYWNTISNIGISEEIKGIDFVYYRLQNQIVFISLIFALIYVSISFSIDINSIAFKLASMALGFMILCLALTFNGKQKIVKDIIIHGMLLVVIYGKTQGLVDFRGYYMIIPTSSIVLLVGQRRDIIYYNIIYLLTIIGGTMILQSQGHELSDDYIFNIILLIICIYAMSGMVYRFRLELDKYRSTVDEQNQTLAKNAKELKRSNQELQQFAYAASHDMQEPLRMVSSFAQLLEEETEGKLSEDEKEYIDYITDGTTRMSALIDDLLQYAKVGKANLVLQTIDPNQIITQKTRDLSLKIQENNVTIEVNNLPTTIEVEPNQMGIVFYNLINNGIKFNKNEHPIIKISATERPQDHLFKIADNGIGIAAKNHQSIFEIFKRLHRKEEYKGTGIGLALVKRIIDKHNGKIWLESELGKGTTFFFTIPKH